jgi:hypothetical protein
MNKFKIRNIFTGVLFILYIASCVRSHACETKVEEPKTFRILELNKACFDKKGNYDIDLGDDDLDCRNDLDLQLKKNNLSGALVPNEF